MNTAPESNEPAPALTELVDGAEDQSQAVKALSEAQEEITALKDRMQEERLRPVEIQDSHFGNDLIQAP
jgi:hypothetical protein